VFLERLFMGCQIQRSLTLKSLQSVGVVGALMELIRMSGVGNVNGKGLGRAPQDYALGKPLLWEAENT
jgi:hypothetical protein